MLLLEWLRRQARQQPGVPRGRTKRGEPGDHDALLRAVANKVLLRVEWVQLDLVRSLR